MAIRKFFADYLGTKMTDKIKGYKVEEYYKFFISTISWSRDKLEAYQLERLKFILEHAIEHSNFFNKRINEAGFDIDKFKYIDEFKSTSTNP